MLPDASTSSYSDVTPQRSTDSFIPFSNVCFLCFLFRSCHTSKVITSPTEEGGELKSDDNSSWPHVYNTYNTVGNVFLCSWTIPGLFFFVQLFFFLIVKCVCCYRFLTLFHMQYNRKGTYNILDHLKLVQLYCHITSGIRGDRSGNGQCGCFWNPCWQWKTKIYNLIILYMYDHSGLQVVVCIKLFSFLQSTFYWALPTKNTDTKANVHTYNLQTKTLCHISTKIWKWRTIVHFCPKVHESTISFRNILRGTTSLLNKVAT